MLTSLEKLGREIRNGIDPQELDPERELDLIAQVQETGSTEAFEELVRGYAKGLSGCLRGFQASASMTVDEALSEVLVGFWENVQNYDLEGDTSFRLSYGVKSLKYRISAARDEQANWANIKPRTLSRYRALHRRYDGNLLEMFKHASEEDLSQDHLMDIHAALTSEGLADVLDLSAEDVAVYGPGDQDSDLVALAFSVIADDQRATDVVWHYYSFDEPDLKRRRTDGDVAELLDVSRYIVQRSRSGALKKIREVMLGGVIAEELSAA